MLCSSALTPDLVINLFVSVADLKQCGVPWSAQLSYILLKIGICGMLVLSHTGMSSFLAHYEVEPRRASPLLTSRMQHFGV